MIYLYNTLTRKKEIFRSVFDKKVDFYTCGPTVYDYPHIGNLRAYIVSDIARRVLEFNGYRVRHIINITDVGHLTSDADAGEDKIEVGSRREKKSADKIATFYTRIFKRDVKKLNLLAPRLWVKATDHIPEMLALIEKLDVKGYVYIINDGLYFDTSKLKNYGELARLDKKGLRPGARVEIVSGKKHPTDFALWKFTPFNTKRQMEWDSPWGRGFPGWHIECSAMSLKYLGNAFKDRDTIDQRRAHTIDLHSGGVDHIGVHHTNEIAQSEAATDKKFVNFWIHNEYLVLDKNKMSKSAGFFITLDDVVKKGFEPLAFRYLCLGTHYRKKMKFSWGALRAAQNALNSIRETACRISAAPKINQIKAITNALNDDLNLPQALALLHQANDYRLWLKFEPVFGLGLKKVKITLAKRQAYLIKQREEAREKKDFTTADKIRRELMKQGIHVEDTPSGPKIIQAMINSRQKP